MERGLGAGAHDRDHLRLQGFEGFFRELTDLTAVGAPDSSAVADLAGKYQLPFAEPDWLTDVIARFDLTAPRR